MCVQCVANAAPYVGSAVIGLRAMSWRAARARLRVDDPSPAGGEPGDEARQPASMP